MCFWVLKVSNFACQKCPPNPKVCPPCGYGRLAHPSTAHDHNLEGVFGPLDRRRDLLLVLAHDDVSLQISEVRFAQFWLERLQLVCHVLNKFPLLCCFYHTPSFCEVKRGVCASLFIDKTQRNRILGSRMFLSAKQGNFVFNVKCFGPYTCSWSKI